MGWVVSVTPDRALPPRKVPTVPIRYEVGWASELVWTQGIEEKSLSKIRHNNLLQKAWTDRGLVHIVDILYCNVNILTRQKTWQRLPTNDRPTLSSERAPQENKYHNSQDVGLKIWSWVPEGARHQDWLADWPSAVTWLWLWGKILLPLPWIEPRSPDRPVRSRSLYWLSKI
jgi:hypothetical protein